MTLDLNADGLLPKGIHSCTFDIVFDSFVLSFPSSQTRHALFQEWKAYNQRLKQFIPKVELVQWINGRYVTNKVNPNDIDFVTYMPLAHYQHKEDQLIEFYTTVSLHDKGLMLLYALFIQWRMKPVTMNITDDKLIGPIYLVRLEMAWRKKVFWKSHFDMAIKKTKIEQINTVLELIARTNRSLAVAQQMNERLQVLQYERLKKQLFDQLTDLFDKDTHTYYVVEKA